MQVGTKLVKVKKQVYCECTLGKLKIENVFIILEELNQDVILEEDILDKIQASFLSGFFLYLRQGLQFFTRPLVSNTLFPLPKKENGIHNIVVGLNCITKHYDLNFAQNLKLKICMTINKPQNMHS